MTPIRRFVLRLATLFRSNRAESELSREINAHLQLLEDKYIAQGMTPREARYAAKREFGGVEQAKEHQRDARSFRWLAGWPMDLKLGVRMLAKSPGLTVIGVIALAVAIGAGAAFLEFSRDLLNPKLDVAGGERIVGIHAWNAERRVQEFFSADDFALLRANARAMDELGAVRPVDRHLTTADGLTAPARAVQISASAFRLFPSAPLYGRPLRDDDERPAAEAVAVIGHDLWRERFNSDPTAVGALVRIGATPYTVVGVMPEGFGFPVRENLWLPLKGGGILTQIFGRLRDGSTFAAAEAEAGVLLKPGLKSRPAANVRMAVGPYLESMMAEDRSSMEVAAFRAINFIFILLLAICGANVATLVFARTAMREGEITVRTALGASRGRISAQLFAEALVLSLLAAVAGLFAARIVGQWGQGLVEQGIGPVPFWWDEGLGYLTVLYAFALAIFAALIVGVVPAMKATGAHLQGRLREAVSGTSMMKFGGLWTGVIMTQAAITVIFLVAVTSFGWSAIKKADDADIKYAREQLLTARVVLDGAPAEADAKASAYQLALEQIADRLAREPGVASVSYATGVPGTIFEQFVYEFQSAGLQAEADARRRTDVLWSEGARVSESFFDTVGLSLVSGRTFTAAEVRHGAPVAVVDERFVRTVLGGRSPLGVVVRERSERGDQPVGPWLEIVGVVKDFGFSLREGPDDAAIYRTPVPGQPLRMLVRTHEPASAMVQPVYAAVRTVDPELRLEQPKSLAQVEYEDDLPDRMFLRAALVIGAIALLLGTAGIYALVSFTLARRTREIGIRVALGAAPRKIITAVFARAFLQIGLGVAAGALPGLVIMTSGTDEAGAMTLVRGAVFTLGVCAFVIGVALVSCTVPLRRALRIDPIQALRAE